MTDAMKKPVTQTQDDQEASIRMFLELINGHIGPYLEVERMLDCDQDRNVPTFQVRIPQNIWINQPGLYPTHAFVQAVRAIGFGCFHILPGFNNTRSVFWFR